MCRPDIRNATDICRSCCLHDAPLCRALTQAAGGQPPRMRRVAHDTMLMEQDTPPPFFGILREGYLRKEKLRDDGRRTLLGLVCPGDILGGFPRQAPGFSLEAATDAVLCVFDANAIDRAVARDRQLRVALLNNVVEQHKQQLELIWRRGALTSRERIIAFLVMAAEIMPRQPQADGSCIVTIELGRRDWADLSNTTVETISRTMTWLSEKSLVTYLGRNCYNFTDIAALAGLAGLESEPGFDPPARARDARPPAISAPPSPLAPLDAIPGRRPGSAPVLSKPLRVRGTIKRATAKRRDQARH